MQREKQCTKCGETKLLDGFHRNKTKAGGVQSQCKECELEYQRRYYEENRDKRIDYSRRYREENRKKVREYHLRYREENRNELLEYDRRYHKENRDKRREYKRRYHDENRDILNQGNKSRYAQKTRTSTLLADRKGAPYSPQEDALLLTNNGRNNYQKAIELGRTYKSVSTRLQRLRKAQTQ